MRQPPPEAEKVAPESSIEQQIKNVSPELLAAITATVKKELLEHLKQPSSAEEQKTRTTRCNRQPRIQSRNPRNPPQLRMSQRRLLYSASCRTNRKVRPRPLLHRLSDEPTPPHLLPKTLDSPPDPNHRDPRPGAHPRSHRGYGSLTVRCLGHGRTRIWNSLLSTRNGGACAMARETLHRDLASS